MIDLFANPLALLLVLAAVALLLAVLVPNRWANANVVKFRDWIAALAGFQLVVAAAMAIALAAGWVQPIHQVLLQVSGDGLLAITVYYDGVGSLMLALVSFVGWIICRFSVRYLDGETSQGQYFRWTSFTIGSVALMTVSGNLLLFMVAWVMTSLGLHRLLLHYGDRPAARRAAWTKFTISRLGDASLIAATILIYREFGTLDFAALFAAATALAESGVASDITTGMHVAGFLVIVGAVTKSAQFPFHTWLPLTMETPTPVSALMHAGIVNAGGYLVIRTSTLVSLTPWTLSLLAIIGAFTALFASLVMLTQTSIKKSLAYSTIAQMGFMLLQCGLGAFSAAMLHILAHSLYKAHAFLSSGSVLVNAASMRGVTRAEFRSSPIQQALAGMSLCVVLAVTFGALGVDLLAKPGGLLLGGLLCLALTHWIGAVLSQGGQTLVVRAMLAAVCLCVVYGVSFVAVDMVVDDNVPAVASPNLSWLVGLVVLFGFIGLFIANTAVRWSAKPAWLDSLYVHASNGFYIESHLRRLLGRVLVR